MEISKTSIDMKNKPLKNTKNELNLASSVSIFLHKGFGGSAQDLRASECRGKLNKRV